MFGGEKKSKHQLLCMLRMPLTAVNLECDIILMTYSRFHWSFIGCRCVLISFYFTSLHALKVHRSFFCGSHLQLFSIISYLEACASSLTLQQRVDRGCMLALIESDKEATRSLSFSSCLPQDRTWWGGNCSKSNKKNQYLKCHGAIRTALKTCVNMPSPLTAATVQNRTSSCSRM